MQDLMSAILAMTLAGSLVSFLLAVLEPISSRLFSAAWHYYARYIVVLLMLVPLSLYLTSCQVVVSQSTPLPESNVGATVYLTGPAMGSALSMTLPAAAIREGRGVSRSLPWHIVWLLGAIIVLTVNLNFYLRFRRSVVSFNRQVTTGLTMQLLEQCKVEMGVKSSLRLAVNAGVRTPMLIGLLRPTVIIPDRAMDQEELKMIFRHELTHLKRGDLWLKVLALLASVIHWFNPVSYIMVTSINRLCEMSCDEAVVASMDLSERKRYAQTILASLCAGKSQPAGVYFALGGNEHRIKRRLSNLLYFKKVASGRMVISIALALLLCATGVVAATIALTSGPVAEAAPIVPDISQSREATISLTWPVPGSVSIGSPYGTRTHPVSKTESFHAGIDVEGEQGAKILAAASGKVNIAEYLTGYGNTVIIDHGMGYTTVYAHAHVILVQAGEQVVAGQEIARVGMTGNALSPHLHFEVHKDGESQDPLSYVTP